MRSKMLFGIGLGLLIGGLLAANRATPAGDGWVLKRARQLGMVYPSGSRLETASSLDSAVPAPQPAAKAVTAPAPVPVPAPPPMAAPAPKTAPPPKVAPPPRTAPPPKAAPPPAAPPQPRPATRPEPAARQVTISEEATLKEIVKSLEQAGVVTTTDDRDLIMLEVRSGRRFVPGTFSIPADQPLEVVMKRITSASR